LDKSAERSGTACWRCQAILPRLPGAASDLSPFLKGVTLTDMCGISRTYSEFERRRVDLCQLLSSTCTQINAEPRVTFTR
jgi:hypothetical protein